MALKVGKKKRLVPILYTGGVVVQSVSPVKGGSDEPLEPPLDPPLIGVMCDKGRFRNVYSSVIREELISHKISKKGVRTIHKSKVYTSF